MDSSAGEYGMARLGLFLVLMGLWRFSDACPASCTCSISRIVCIDSVPGIEDFPVLTLDDMENITEIYIANQNRLFDINDNSLRHYINLRNLTVTKTRLTSISSDAFFNNTRLQYVNLRDNNLSTLSWRTFQNFNITFPLLLSGNPLDCVCENLWIKLRLQEESEGQELRCMDDRGETEAFVTLTPPDCVPPKVEVDPKIVTKMQGSNVKAVCRASGSPLPEILWNLDLLTTHHEIEPMETESSLTLSGLSPDDNGRVIICSAENMVGQTEATLQLNILFAPHHPAAAGARAEPSLVHPLQRDGEPQARAAVVPRECASPGAGLHPHHDPPVHRERGPWLPAAGQPHAHSQWCVQTGGKE
uniref:Neurotrophic tyrosine kinase, receptor, type 2b n=1 Tax=Lates calcarifer TaxID=8187 RepID=A0A4W6C5A3_LATCA